LCASLGDCGSYINYVGEGSNNAYATGARGYKLDDDGNEKDEKSSGVACGGVSLFTKEILKKEFDIEKDWDNCPDPDWTDYASNVEVDKDNVGKTPNLREQFELLIGEDATEFYLGDGDINHISTEAQEKILKKLGTIPGAAGAIALGLTHFFPAEALSMSAPYLEVEATGSAFGTALANIAGATAAAGAGALLVSWITNMMGVSGPAATASTIAGGIGGAAAYSAATSPATFFTGLSGILLWGAVAVIVVSIIFGGPSYETRYVEFTCNPWDAPAGGDNCELCNADPLKPCNEYRCQSLGATCELLNDDTTNPPCVSMIPDDNPPTISPGEPATGFAFRTTGLSNGIDLRLGKSGESGCVDQGDWVEFSIETDKFAHCKWSTIVPERNGNYEDMIGQIASNAWSKEHNIKFLAPEVDDVDDDYISGQTPERKADINLYIKCEDGQKPAKYNFNAYVINFCVDEKDTDPVNYALTKFNPSNNGYAQKGATEKEIVMWINEPAECKYSLEAGKEFDEMEFEWDCDTGYNDRSVFGWKCNTTLTELVEGENEIYIKCKDQPIYKDTDEEKRQTNIDDLKYTLNVCEDGLEIKTAGIEYDDVFYESGDKIKAGVSTISFELQVKTSGGSEEGVAECKWGTQEDGSRWQMKTSSTIHTQRIPRGEGEYKFYIKCSDTAGNVAEEVVSIEIELDTSAPEIIRASHQGNYLMIITDEDAICYYDKFTCDELDNMTKVDSNFNTEHIFTWEDDTKYFIKCKDKFGKVPDDCNVFRTSEEQ